MITRGCMQRLRQMRRSSFAEPGPEAPAWNLAATFAVTYVTYKSANEPSAVYRASAYGPSMPLPATPIASYRDIRWQHPVMHT